MIREIRFLVYAGRLWRQPPVPAERLEQLAFAAAKKPDLEGSVRGLGRLLLRSQAAIDRQIRRKEQIDRRVLVVTDAILTETLRRIAIVRPESDPAPLERQLRDLRKMRYKRKEADALATDLAALAPTGVHVPKRRRRTNRHSGGYLRRVFKVRPEALARDAASAARIRDPALRHVRLMWLAQRGHSEVKRQGRRAEGVDERLLVITHAVTVESMRQTRSFHSSIGIACDETPEPLEEQLAELQTLAYDQNEAEKFAIELGKISLNDPE